MEPWWNVTLWGGLPSPPHLRQISGPEEAPGKHLRLSRWVGRIPDGMLTAKGEERQQ